MNNMTVTKKGNWYMFLTTPCFEFSDIENYLAPGLSYDDWCKVTGCEVQKLVFPYEWLDNYDQLQHIRPVEYKTSTLSFRVDLQLLWRNTPSLLENFTLMDWLRVFNKADIIPFIEAVDKTHKQYYPIEVDMLKDAVSIPGISMTSMLNKALKMKKPGDPDLCAPGQPCTHKCNKECIGIGCKDCK